MRHIHDGELHAFLDGALDLLPEGRGDEIREHLAECSACRERLQDEERIRTEAGALLGEPDLSAVTLPSFEELRQLAEAPAPDPARRGGEDAPTSRSQRGPLRGLPLAWAATIVLALGVGWMGGQIWESMPARTLPVSPRSQAESGISPGIDAEGAASPLQAAGQDLAVQEGSELQSQLFRNAVSDSVTGGAPVAEEAERSAASVETPPPLVGLRETVVTASRETPTPAEVTAEEAREAEVSRRRSAGRSVLDSIAAPAVGVAQPLPQGMSALVVRADSGQEGRMAPAALMDPVSPIQPSAEDLRLGLPSMGFADATSMETASMAIPGLEVLSTEWEERVPGEKALLIRQLVAPGDTLELRYLGLLLSSEPASDEARERATTKEAGSVGRVYANVLSASLPPGWFQVVMERERGLVVARGPFAEPHLKSLLKRLR